MQHCKELSAKLISARQRQAGCLVQDPEPIERSPLCHGNRSESILLAHFIAVTKSMKSTLVRRAFGPAKASGGFQNYVRTARLWLDSNDITGYLSIVWSRSYIAMWLWRDGLSPYSQARPRLCCPPIFSTRSNNGLEGR